MAYAGEKTYGSAKYHGMKVGGVHHWTYPDGQWTERKVAPDQWDFTFTSLKRRNRKAPAGSGAEVGSGYHWLIIAHQWVDKLDANTYATQLEGRKHLLAFRKPDWPLWNTQFRNARQGARERTIAALKDMIRELEAGGEGVENVIDQAALVDLAATYEAEEGLPPGSTRLASRLARVTRPRLTRRQAKRKAAGEDMEEGKEEEDVREGGDVDVGEDADPMAVALPPPRRRRQRHPVRPRARPAGGAAPLARPGPLARRRPARQPARRRAAARRRA